MDVFVTIQSKGSEGDRAIQLARTMEAVARSYLEVELATVSVEPPEEDPEIVDARNNHGQDKVTLEMFKKAMGRDPWNDDLERCNCPRAGEVGHWDCGWDEVANRPCFAGGARKPRKSREVSFFGQEPAVTGDLDGQELLAGSGPELGLLEPGTTILGSIIGGK